MCYTFPMSKSTSVFNKTVAKSYKKLKEGKIKKARPPMRQRMESYIKFSLTGMSKNQAARLSGYGDEYAKNPYRIEKRKAYVVMYEEITSDLTDGLSNITTSLKERLDRGEASTLKLLDHIEAAEKLSKIMERMTPKVEVTQNGKGEVTKKSIWGSVSQQNNTEE